MMKTKTIMSATLLLTSLTASGLALSESFPPSYISENAHFNIQVNATDSQLLDDSESSHTYYIHQVINKAIKNNQLSNVEGKDLNKPTLMSNSQFHLFNNYS